MNVILCTSRGILLRQFRSYAVKHHLKFSPLLLTKSTSSHFTFIPFWSSTLPQIYLCHEEKESFSGNFQSQKIPPPVTVVSITTLFSSSLSPPGFKMMSQEFGNILFRKMRNLTLKTYFMNNIRKESGACDFHEYEGQVDVNMLMFYRYE
jgi:hypothetical protein